MTTASRLKTPALVGIIAGAIILTAFLVAILRPDSQGGAGPEGGDLSVPEYAQGDRPVTVSPAGRIPGGTLSLQWQKVAGIEEYEAIVLDNRGQLIWRSERIRDHRVELPENRMKYLVPGPAFFWYVIGHAPDGTQVESDTASFVISG